MVKMKFMPVASGMMSEKLLVDRALKRASAERTISKKEAIKGIFSKNSNHSCMLARLFPLSCHLINAAPETFKSRIKHDV